VTRDCHLPLPARSSFAGVRVSLAKTPAVGHVSTALHLHSEGDQEICPFVLLRIDEPCANAIESD
jgi:hypothetical protein